MDPTETGLLILTLVLIITLVTGLTQQIMSRRQRRQDQLERIQENIRHISYLVESLPAPFLSSEIRQVLDAGLSLQFDQLRKLQRKTGTEQQLRLQQQLAEPLQGAPLAADALTLLPDQHSARKVRALLRDLAQLIKQQHQDQGLSPEIANPALRQIKRGYHLVSCDLSIMDAKTLETTRGPKVALHQYRSCLSKLRAIRTMEHTVAQIEHLQAHIERLDQQLQHSDIQ